MRQRKLIADEAALYECAVRALARRMHSVAEIKRLLRRRVVVEGGEALIEVVVARLKDQKYLNDSAYADLYSASRRDNDKLGRMRVVAGLRARGVHAEVIDKAVRSAYDAQDEEQLVRAFLRRKRAARPNDAREAARVFRMLARAGYSTRSITAVLRKWKVDDELLDALESERD
jgi:regulatory protein